MAKVFILERTDQRKRNINIQDAKAYGEIVYLYDGVSDRPSIWTEEFKEDVSARFEERGFNPEEDYFCVAGYFVPVTIATSILITEYGRIKVLFYSATEQDYVPSILGELNHV